MHSILQVEVITRKQPCTTAGGRPVATATLCDSKVQKVGVTNIRKHCFLVACFLVPRNVPHSSCNKCGNYHIYAHKYDRCRIYCAYGEAVRIGTRSKDFEDAMHLREIGGLSMAMIKKIITADNTETFLNEEIGESYHSQTGAVEEALKKYVIPCKIRELAKKIKEEGKKKDRNDNGSNSRKIRILDMFFGMGYNSAMAVSEALDENPKCEIEVIGLEFDPEIIAKIQEVSPPIRFFKNYKKINKDNLSIKVGNVSVRVVLGDARETIKELESEQFDAVFYDPFSPKTAPDMWHEDIFKEVYRVMNRKGILATYSCARLARENMSKADLFWDDGPIVGRRGPGTIATKWV